MTIEFHLGSHYNLNTWRDEFVAWDTKIELTSKAFGTM